jgi:hypothetical protein
MASTQRRKNPLHVGLVGLQSECQYSSATVTNPGIIPVDTPAKLREYHPETNPSTNPIKKDYERPWHYCLGRPANCRFVKS